jgi:hypothetical protein
MTTIGLALLAADLSQKAAIPYGKNSYVKLLSRGRYSAAVIKALFCMGFAWTQVSCGQSGVNAHTHLQVLASSKSFTAAPRETGSHHSSGQEESS